MRQPAVITLAHEVPPPDILKLMPVIPIPHAFTYTRYTNATPYINLKSNELGDESKQEFISQN